MEEWRNIEGYERLYQVSNMGRIKSTQYHNGTYERILKPNKDKKGYLTVHLYKNGKRKWVSVHKIVAQAFIDNPDNLPCINHKNENKSDNRVKNLEYCDYTYNNNYGSRNQQVSDKLSKRVQQYSLKGEFIADYPSTQEVERKLGFNHGYISKCCLGKYKTAYGYIWRYAD